jgi:predicted transglutaminase-like cysteine proteinase
VPANGATTIALTAKRYDRIVEINSLVNSTIRARTDLDHWGVLDRWDLAEDGTGDCEDYQLLKRKMLVQAGFPRRAMSMAVVLDFEGNGHAVLILHTTKGDIILDNLYQAPIGWRESGYLFVKREGRDGREWLDLLEQRGRFSGV